MRIVAGKFRGTALTAPKNNDIRPTSDRVRESIFNILTHMDGFPPLEDLRILDLFAGTGALGLEALSRGGAYALFVEEAAQARALIRRNIETLGLTGATRIYRRDATRLGAIGTLAAFDLVFADPPYGKQMADQALLAAATGGWLVQGAFIVVEEQADADFLAPEGFSTIDQRKYGDTAVHFLRYAS